MTKKIKETTNSKIVVAKVILQNLSNLLLGLSLLTCSASTWHLAGTVDIAPIATFLKASAVLLGLVTCSVMGKWLMNKEVKL